VLDAPVLTSNQKVIFQQVLEYFREVRRRDMRNAQPPLEFPATLASKERIFLMKACTELCLNVDASDGEPPAGVPRW
jgi:hypothetical protein